MRKDEYLYILSERLKVLPLEEYNDIMEYYKEYFEDAGSENEEAVIKELGDVEALAKKIISENMLSHDSQNGTYVNGNAVSGQGGQSYVSYPQPYQESYNQPYQQQGQAQAQTQGMSTGWKVAIAIITFPIWIGIAGALIGMITGFGVAAVACIFAGIAAIIAGGFTFTASVAAAFVVIGCGFVVIAVGLGFLMATVGLIHLVVKICNVIFKKNAKNQPEPKHI